MIDAGAFPEDTTIGAAVVVVGSGPAGMAVASELADAGHQVVVLEAGPLHEDRRARRDAGGHNADPWYYRLQQSRARGFGGTSQRWAVPRGVRVQPLGPLDLERRPGVPHSGWPIDYAQLARHYPAAEAFLGLAPDSYEVAAWQRPDRPPLGLPEELVETTVFRFAPRGRIGDRRGDFAARRNLQVILGAAVTELRTNEAGTAAVGVRARTAAGRTLVVDATTVVLACGGIGNARLLLATHADAGGLGNRRGLVGRFFGEHPHARSGTVTLAATIRDLPLGLYDVHDRGDQRGQAKLRVHPDVVRREGLPNSAWWVMARDREVVTRTGRAVVDLRQLREYRRLTPGTARRLTTVATHPGAAARAIRRHRAPSPRPSAGRLQLAFMSEQLPNPASRVTIGRARDRFGVPLAELDWRLTSLDRDGIRRTQDLLDRAFQQAGLGRVEGRFWTELPRPNLGAGYHHMGTTRMATSPSEGVVDPDGQVHGVAGLFVAGSSVFPTYGYANPTLTLVALSFRLAEHLRARLR